MDFDRFMGMSTGPQTLDYTWRDVALYALAVGAGEDELDYYYEKNMKTLPAFGVLPCWNAIQAEPHRPFPYPAPMLVMDAMAREEGIMTGGLDMEHELIVHRPIDPVRGRLSFEDTITKIYDRGEGKGIVIESSLPVYDGAGNLLCENIARFCCFAGGGYGGPKPPKPRFSIPDRAPDLTVSDHISRTQNALYRLTGDTNRVHIDPDYAGGGRGPFMQGLCSFGFACRMAIKALIPGEPERMTRMSAQMRNICWPDTDIEVQIWKFSDGLAVFRMIDKADGRAILDKGLFAWRN